MIEVKLRVKQRHYNPVSVLLDILIWAVSVIIGALPAFVFELFYNPQHTVGLKTRLILNYDIPYAVLLGTIMLLLVVIINKSENAVIRSVMSKVGVVLFILGGIVAGFTIALSVSDDNVLPTDIRIKYNFMVILFCMIVSFATIALHPLIEYKKGE